MSTRRRLLGVGGASATIGLVILVTVGVNILALRAGTATVDLTEGRRLTLSDQTERVLKSLRSPLRIDAFVRSDSSGRDVRALLDRYKDASRRVAAEVVDPDADPGKAQRLGITRYGDAILNYRNRRVDVSVISEIELTSAVLHLVRGKTPVVCFVTAHGEAAIDDEGPDGLSRLAKLAQRNGFDPRPTSLASGEVDPTCDLLVLAGPRVPLAEQEQAAVKNHLDADGKLLILIDALTGADVNPITAPWGIRFLGGVVVDTERNLNDDVTSPIILDFPSTNRIVERVPSLLSPASAGLGVDDPDPREGLHVSTLARSSGRSFLSRDPESSDQSQSLLGPVVVAAAADFSGVRGTRPAIHRTRLLVVAGVALAHNQILDTLGNATFFANGLSWLAQDEVLLTITAKDPGEHPLAMTGPRRDAAFVVAVIAMPALALAGGAIVGLVRRRR